MKGDPSARDRTRRSVELFRIPQCPALAPYPNFVVTHPPLRPLAKTIAQIGTGVGVDQERDLHTEGAVLSQSWEVVALRCARQRIDMRAMGDGCLQRGLRASDGG